jgi:hypothetical protein
MHAGRCTQVSVSVVGSSVCRIGYSSVARNIAAADQTGEEKHAASLAGSLPSPEHLPWLGGGRTA